MPHNPAGERSPAPVPSRCGSGGGGLAAAVSPAQAAREAAGLTLEQAALKAVVSPAYLRRLERPGARISYALACRLSKHYACPLGVFVRQKKQQTAITTTNVVGETSPLRRETTRRGGEDVTTNGKGHTEADRPAYTSGKSRRITPPAAPVLAPALVSIGANSGGGGGVDSFRSEAL